MSNDAASSWPPARLVWLGNNLAFALLYWLIDGGGPIARSQLPPRSTSPSRST